MTLHVILDSRVSPLLKADDIILASIGSTFDYGEHLVFYLDYSHIDRNSNVISKFNDVFNITGDKVSLIRNNIYIKFFRTILAAIENIKDIINKKGVDSIALYGGSKYVFMSPYYAEGEGCRILYKTNWLVNACIYYTFSGTINIKWINRNPVFIFKIYAFLRNFYFKTVLILSNIKQCLCDCNRKRHQSVGTRYLSIIELPLQKNHITELYDFWNEKDFSFFSTNKLMTKTEGIGYIPFPSLFVVFRCLWNSRLHAKFNLSHFDMPLSYSALTQCINCLYLEYLIREKRLTAFFNDSTDGSKPVLITDVTVGFDSVSYHSLAAIKGWTHKNYQYVAMGKILYPNLDLADEYYLYARKTYELYRQLSKTFRVYFPLKPRKVKKYVEGSSVVITLFLQPDRFVYEYIDLMNSLFVKLSQLGLVVKVQVKPHYRQNEMNMIKSACQGFDFVEIMGLSDNCGALLDKTDIAITIHSSVIFEAMTHSVMTIVYNPDGRYSDTVYNNDICFPEVNFVVKSSDEIVSLIADFNSKYEEFLQKLSVFSSDNINNVN